MGNSRELWHTIHNLLKTQIEFGVYRLGDSLPTMKEAGGYFLASVDTVRLAYLRLKEENYISLSTSVGATVIVPFSEKDIQRHIQDYFVCRRSAMLDLVQSLMLLFGYGRWLALKNASPQMLDELERISLCKELPSPYRMSRYLLLIYGNLHNDLFTRLIWQVFLFMQVPFLSIPQNVNYFDQDRDPIMGMVRLCRAQDWDQLWNAVLFYRETLVTSLTQFYDKAVPLCDDVKQIGFSWSIYKKASQLCYSLCEELLHSIHRGEYLAGDFLPSPAKLAEEKGVSVNTIRRTIALLNKLGATRSINGVGTKVLSPLDSAENCDLSDVTIQKRLLDFVKSFHILALSCRLSAKLTVESMDTATINGWVAQMEEVKRRGIYEDFIYICYRYIAAYAPYRAIRTVYAELARQLFWGFPVRNIHGNREETNAYFLPCLEEMAGYLRQADASSFSKKLEELQIAETKLTVKYLADRGIMDAGSLLIP